MSNTETVGIADVERLARVEAPDLVAAIEAYLDQGEPYDPNAKPGSMDLAQLKAALRSARGRRTKKARKEQSTEVWGRYLAQERVAPQLALADLVVKLYETPTGPARAALLELIANGPLVFGLWGGLKRVYKRAERDLDAELIGAFAVRFDTSRGRPGDVSIGTMNYMSRRTARFFRLLGKALPEQYPSFAVEVLRRYPAETDPRYNTTGRRIVQSWSAKWGYDRTSSHAFNPPYRALWTVSPDPLMLLLETCGSNGAAEFAIEGLQEMFPEVLRGVTPSWLARLCFRPLYSAHDLVIDTLERSPEFHAARLRELGLHDAVLALLKSESSRAQAYAITYARGQAQSLSVEFLVGLLDDDVYPWDVVKFGAELLTTRPARELGLPMVLRLLRYRASQAWAYAALDKDFGPAELTTGMLRDLLLDRETCHYARGLVDKRYPNRGLPVSFWIDVLEDPREDNRPWDVTEHCFQQIEKFPVSDLPSDWILERLHHTDYGSRIVRMLRAADRLPVGLDAERIKGFVFDVATRNLAFTLLDNTKLVPVDQVGLPWLLALAKRADPTLHGWAHRYLLQHVPPATFGDGALAAGVDRLFALATGKRETDAMRAFASTYLLCHHPRIGAQQSMAQAVGLTPSLPHEVYTAERTWAALWDDRPDVRRFGVTIARVELARWADPARVFELAESPNREIRNVAYDALMQAGSPTADPDLALPVDALDPALVFSMTESTHRGTREVATALIRAHYARLGGAERLGWLMTSADREVRNFAVRLLWEKHRPREVPAGWRVAGVATAAAEPFEDAEALRDLLRRLLFAVPPARGGEKGEGKAKRIPASVAKRRIVEVIRDFGVRDRAFAVLVVPVLEEFTGSIAKGEWQACLSALLAIRAANGLGSSVVDSAEAGRA